MKSDGAHQFIASAWWIFVIVVTAASCSPSSSRQPEGNVELVALGRKIFADQNLSRDRQVSCASCHRPDLFFSDGRPKAVGINGLRGTRNAPSLLDARLMTSFFWDGREATLENAVTQALTNPVEMGLSGPAAVNERLAEDTSYGPLAQLVFDKDTLSTDEIRQALLAYLQSLPLEPTRYDLTKAARNPTHADDDASQGLALFSGKAACADCHSLGGTPALFTDNGFHHTGIGFDRVAGSVGTVIARLASNDSAQVPLGALVLADPSIAELGRFAVTKKPSDMGAFRTPSLRNVARTAPYMHDGSIATLPEAVEREIYYRSLTRGRPISLTVDEQRQLLAFLETLNTVPSGDSPARHDMSR